MRRIIHVRPVKSGIQGQKDRDHHPLHGDMGSSAFPDDDQKQQGAGETEDRAAGSDGIVKTSRGELIGRRKKIPEYRGQGIKDQETNPPQRPLHDLPAEIEQEHIVDQMFDIRMQKSTLTFPFRPFSVAAEC